MTKVNDVSQSPTTPQFQLGATSDEAAMSAEVADSPIPGPGAIADRLQNQQWQMSRAQPDASMSRDHGTPYG